MKLPLNIHLKDALELADSGVWGPDDSDNGISVLRSTNFNDNGTLDVTKLAIRDVPEKKRVSKLLVPGDILIEISGGGPKQPVGRVCYFDGDDRPHLFGNFCQRFRSKPQICNSRYLFWYLFWYHSIGRTIQFQKQTTGIRNLEYKRYISQIINIPPISEQRRIVEILDQADAIRKKRIEADKISERIIPALFYKMFGDPLYLNAGNSFKRLYDCTEIVMGQSPPGDTYNQEGQGLPFFQGKMEFGDYYPTVRKWCSEPTRIAEPGDVLMSVRAPVGPTNIVRETCAIGRGLCAIRPKPAITNTQFIHSCLMAMETWIARKGQGSTFTAIKRKDVESIPFPDVPIQRQTSFALKVQQIREYLLKTKDSSFSLETFFTTLLYRAFSGDLTDKWREAHMKELLPEMEEQAKYLNIEE